MATATVIKDYRFVECVCKQCGHRWYPRKSHRPVSCANKCVRMHYWDTDPATLPEYVPRPRAKSKKKK